MCLIAFVEEEKISATVCDGNDSSHLNPNRTGLFTCLGFGTSQYLRCRGPITVNFSPGINNQSVSLNMEKYLHKFDDVIHNDAIILTLLSFVQNTQNKKA